MRGARAEQVFGMTGFAAVRTGTNTRISIIFLNCFLLWAHGHHFTETANAVRRWVVCSKAGGKTPKENAKAGNEGPADIRVQ